MYLLTSHQSNKCPNPLLDYNLLLLAFCSHYRLTGHPRHMMEIQETFKKREKRNAQCD